MSVTKQNEVAAKAKQAYLANRVLGADTSDLLLMLYEGLLQNVIAGERGLREENWEAANDALARARRIVTYLVHSLREEGGEVSSQLRRLYTFCFENIGRANLENKPELLPGVIKVLQELSGAWSEIARREAEPALGRAEGEK